MQILNLTLKKKWFDMIAAGIKTEEPVYILWLGKRIAK